MLTNGSPSIISIILKLIKIFAQSQNKSKMFKSVFLSRMNYTSGRLTNIRGNLWLGPNKLDYLLTGLTIFNSNNR
jgi:hypothetical protein